VRKAGLRPAHETRVVGPIRASGTLGEGGIQAVVRRRLRREIGDRVGPQHIRHLLREELALSERRLGAKINAVDRKLDQAQEDIAAILTTVIQYHSVLEQRVTRIEARLRS